MPYLPDATLALFRRSVNLGIYFNLQTAPPLRLWGGLGDIEQELPAAEAGALIYKSCRITDLPDLEIILNGGAERATITLEGVSADAMDEIAGLDPPVLGKALFIGIAAHDAKWQPASDILPLSTAIADFWHMAQSRAAYGENPKRSISLDVGFGDTGRARPVRVTYADRHQQQLFPGDEFCKDVPRYHRGYIIAWPRF